MAMPAAPLAELASQYRAQLGPLAVVPFEFDLRPLAVAVFAWGVAGGDSMVAKTRCEPKLRSLSLLRGPPKPADSGSRGP